MSSTLNRTGEQRPNVTKGHGTDALGPSDLSDSGSDTVGGPGLAGDLGIGLDTGTNEDPDGAVSSSTAGPDIGDANLDSNSDASGTGERASAGRDVGDARDIFPDGIEDIADDTIDDDEDQVDGQ